MSLILKLRGARAVSAFRLDKLNSRLAAIRTPARIAAAEYWHFVEAERALEPRESQVLERLLRYGEPAPAGEGACCSACRAWARSPRGRRRRRYRAPLRPRRGASRRAGVAWFFSGGRLLDSDLHRVFALIHDRMTETVLRSIDEADALFRHHEPKPLAVVNVLARGRAALDEANTALGLALASMKSIISSPTTEASPATQRRGSSRCSLRRTRSIAGTRSSTFVDHRWGSRGADSLRMIKTRTRRNPAGTVVAYADNAAVVEGRSIARFYRELAGATDTGGAHAPR